MLHDPDIIRSIQEYLVEHFPNADVEQWQDENQESINFGVVENNETYVLRVMDECLEGLRADEVKLMLGGYNVAKIMRSIGDFPIVVTNSGCIFGSP